MRLLLLASLLFAPAARAALPWWMPNPHQFWPPAFDLTGHVDIEGRVDVPLLSTNGWTDTPVVAATTEDGSVHLVAVDLGATEFKATEGFARATGARIVERPRLPWADRGKVKLARLGSFSIGDATFSDIPVKTSGSLRVGAMSVDAVLPPALFEDLAVAVLNSKGQLSLAPADQVGQLLGDVPGAATLTWSRREGREARLGDLHYYDAPQAFLVSGTLGGQEVEVRLFGSGPSTVGATLVEGREPAARIGTRDVHLLDVEVPGLGTFSGPYLVRTRPSYDVEDDFIVLGEALSDTWDVVVDPSAQAVAIRTGVQPVRQSAYPLLVQQVLEDVQQEGSDDGSDGEASAAYRAAGGWEAFLRVSPAPGEAPALPDALPETDDGDAYARLGDLLCDAGRGDLCAEALKKAAELKPDDCDAQQAWGRFLSATDPAAAEPVLARAAELWAAWDALTPEQRADYREAGDEAEVRPQASSCHTIWADVLANQVRLGQFEQAEATWIAHRDHDLDGTLSRNAGGERLVAGDVDGSAAPFRLAASRHDPLARVGLAVVEDAAFRPGQAIAHAFDAAIDRPYDVPTTETLAVVAAGAGGPTTSVLVLSKLVALRPHDPVARMILAEARIRAGQDATADLEAALDRFEVLRALNPENVILMGQHARCLLDAGAADEARALAEQALASGLVVPQAKLVLARLEGREAEVRQELARLGVSHPGFAAAFDW